MMDPTTSITEEQQFALVQEQHELLNEIMQLEDLMEAVNTVLVVLASFACEHHLTYVQISADTMKDAYQQVFAEGKQALSNAIQHYYHVGGDQWPN